MKNFPLLFCFILFLAFAASGQTNQNSSCPTIDISGGGVVTSPGEAVSFMAIIDTEGKDLKIEYVWTVSNGKIISGQGTQTISVEPPLNENITVTLEVKGLPEGCQNTVSYTLGCGLRPSEAVKVGEFLNFDTQTEKAQLKELREKIFADPYAQVYVIGRFKENTSEKKVAQKLKKLGSFLMKEFSLDASKITMVKVFGELEYTEIWLVPAGAYPPTPQN